MSSFGYLIFSFFGFANENRSVRGPTFPINIMMMITSFPRSDRLPVIPIDNPTVPKAETTSKRISINEAFSDRVIIKIAVSTNIKLTIAIASALRINLGWMLLLPIVKSSFPRRKVMVAKTIMIAVVNLIPPAVDALPPPINMRIIIRKRVASSRLAISSVLKPAVLGETAWK